MISQSILSKPIFSINDNLHRNTNYRKKFIIPWLDIVCLTVLQPQRRPLLPQVKPIVGFSLPPSLPLSLLLTRFLLLLPLLLCFLPRPFGVCPLQELLHCTQRTLECTSSAANRPGATSRMRPRFIRVTTASLPACPPSCLPLLADICRAIAGCNSQQSWGQPSNQPTNQTTDQNDRPTNAQLWRPTAPFEQCIYSFIYFVNFLCKICAKFCMHLTEPEWSPKALWQLWGQLPRIKPITFNYCTNAVRIFPKLVLPICVQYLFGNIMQACFQNIFLKSPLPLWGWVLFSAIQVYQCLGCTIKLELHELIK